MGTRRLWILLALIFLAQGAFSLAHAGSPACGNPPAPYENNTNYIFTIDVILSTTTTTKGTAVTVTAIPKDDSGNPTRGRGEPEWAYEPTAQYSVTDNPCFTQTITASSDGVITILVAQDGITGSAVLTIGAGGTPPVPDGNAEPQEVCAYKNAQGALTCVKGSNFDTKCTQSSECTGATKCTRVNEAVACNSGTPFSNQLRPTPESPGDLGQLIQRLFNWSLGVLGITIFVVIIFSGAQVLLYAGIPSKVSEAWDRMRDAVLGAILLLAAYLILNVINPNLVSQTTSLPGIPSGSTQVK